jgi:hypothetical protein
MKKLKYRKKEAKLKMIFNEEELKIKASAFIRKKIKVKKRT